jgi:hypothetical protein
MHNEDASSHIMMIIAEVEMGGTCGTHDRTKMCTIQLGRKT